MSTSNGNVRSGSSTLVWDLPTRVFHWVLVVSFAIAWLTSENDRFMYAHVYGGYVLFCLLMFRLVWGVYGSRHARFHSFAHDWSSVTEYLKALLNGQAERYIGHNPAGGWAIFLMLLLCVLASISGLIVLGGEEGHGPFKHLIAYDIGENAKEIHEFLANAMIAMVGLHLAGVVVESVIHKENLIWAMLSGRKTVEKEEPSVRAFHIIGAVLLITVLGTAGYYFRGYVVESDAVPFKPYRNVKLADNTTWRKECGECHLAFHPSLLPARSWELMMKQQSDHFGDALELDPETTNEITQFLVENSADKGTSEPAHKINARIKPDETPLRVTETRYWKRKHSAEFVDEVYWKSEKVKSKANCGACHLDANTGWFEDSDMRLPKLSTKSEETPR